MERQKYHYKGPVFEFGNCLTSDWEGSTYAESEAKARSNLAYQFKKKFNRVPGSKIRLTGKITTA